MDIRKINDIRKNNRNYVQEQLKQNSKSLLKNSSSKRVKTTMIGALDVFEKYFGYMWGYGKNENELTREEAHNRLVWESARNAILDKGNNQIRLLEEEFGKYNITWEGYKFKLPVKKVDSTKGKNDE